MFKVSVVSERSNCERCGQPMFHLAHVCPHCGARRGTDVPDDAPAKKPERAPLHLSADEARALLSVQSPSSSGAPTLVDVAKDLLWPRAGVLELVTSLVAAPLTVSSIVALALARLRERRGRRDESMQGAALLAVPATAALLAVMLWESSAPAVAYACLGVTFVAWAVRAFARAHADDGLR